MLARLLASVCDAMFTVPPPPPGSWMFTVWFVEPADGAGAAAAGAAAPLLKVTLSAALSSAWLIVDPGLPYCSCP